MKLVGVPLCHQLICVRGIYVPLGEFKSMGKRFTPRGASWRGRDNSKRNWVRFIFVYFLCLLKSKGLGLFQPAGSQLARERQFQEELGQICICVFFVFAQIYGENKLARERQFRRELGRQMFFKMGFYLNLSLFQRQDIIHVIIPWSSQPNGKSLVKYFINYYTSCSLGVQGPKVKRSLSARKTKF